MNSFRCRRLVLAVLAALAVFAPLACSRAQTIPTTALVNIYSFGTAAGNGYDPKEGLIHGRDGSFYGTTYDAGDTYLGTVFRVTQDGVLTTLHTFTGLEGKHPSALIEDRDGNFYGTTSQGGANDRGTVFRFSPDGTLTTLYTFAASESDFYNSGLVRDDDGTLYGATEGGGGNNTGTIYKLTPKGVHSVLHQFNADPGNGVDADGLYPTASMIRGSDGNLYGTTARGGPAGFGTVFRITPRGALTTLHGFTQAEGAFPAAPLLQANDGNFYGTTYGFFLNVGILPTTNPGVRSGTGSVFKMTPDGSLSVLYASNGGGSFGPHGQLLQAADGTLYGTTEEGGNGDGEIFKVTPDGKVSFVAAANYYEYTGDYLDGSLVQGDDGNLYGVSYEGGTRHYGGIFRLDFTPAYLSFTASKIVVAEQAGSVSVRVHRSGDPHGVVSARCQTFDSDSDDDPDYTPTKTFLTWADGDTADKIFTVPILDRGVYEGDTQTFSVGLSDVSAGTFTALPNLCRVTVNEAKIPVPPVTLAATVAQVSAGSGEAAEALVSIPAVQNTDVIVDYAVRGTAVSGADYVALKGTAKIKAGQTSRTIKVAPLGAGPGPGGKRTVVLTLQSGNGYTVGTTDKIKLKIVGQ